MIPKTTQQNLDATLCLRGQFKAVTEEAELLDDNLGPMEGWVIIPEVRLMRCLLGLGVRFVYFSYGDGPGRLSEHSAHIEDKN